MFKRARAVRVMLDPVKSLSFPLQGVNVGQQASLQFAESLDFFPHIFVQRFSGLFSLHLFAVLFLSFALHVVSSLSAMQSFSESFSDETTSSGAVPPRYYSGKCRSVIP